MSNLKIGQTIRVTVRFADFDAVNGTDELLDPDTVTAALYKYNSSSSVFELQSSLTPVVKDDVGVYHYDWTTPDNGRYRILFTGTLVGATPSIVENPRDFYVGTAAPTVTLGSTLEYLFFGELDPLYLDPEHIKIYYGDVEFSEAAEIIHKVSLDLQDWFGENLTVTSQMQEYIVAATLCQLSKIYIFDGGMNGFSRADTYTLGDLSVKDSASAVSNSRGSINRGNAASWCELASLLRDELLGSRVNIRSVVKADSWKSPIPKRGLRRFD